MEGAAAGQTMDRREDGFELRPGVREEYGQRADGILAAYPHATNADALKAAQDIMRESTFAWLTWAWAMLQSEKGKGRAFVYYYAWRREKAGTKGTR
jgi:para-nitrobenzyl esterase